MSLKYCLTLPLLVSASSPPCFGDLAQKFGAFFNITFQFVFFASINIKICRTPIRYHVATQDLLGLGYAHVHQLGHVRLSLHVGLHRVHGHHLRRHTATAAPVGGRQYEPDLAHGRRVQPAGRGLALWREGVCLSFMCKISYVTYVWL